MYMGEDIDSDKWKRIFLSEYIFLDSLCFEANILKEIESNRGGFLLVPGIEANLKQIRLLFASICLVANKYKKPYGTSLYSEGNKK